VTWHAFFLALNQISAGQKKKIRQLEKAGATQISAGREL